MTVPEKSFKPGAVCPLEGTRVVDLSRLVSRNMVSCQLADFRAEVIKIDGSNATTFANPRFRSNSDQGKNGELCEVSIVHLLRRAPFPRIWKSSNARKSRWRRST